MSEAWIMEVTDDDIDAYVKASQAAPSRPVALEATYNRDFDMLILSLDTGRRLLIPREELQGLEDATDAQLGEIEIHCGVDIAWPQLNVDHYLPHLLEGKYSTERWRDAQAAKRAAA